MSDQLQTWTQGTLWDFGGSTYLLESDAGSTPCVLQDGSTTCQSGPEAAPVSRSRQRAKGKACKTSDTSGQKCSGLSNRVGRRSSSASKSHPQKLSALSLKLISLSRFGAGSLLAPTNSPSDSFSPEDFTGIVDGSMEYVQTWRESVTPCGSAYWEHTASARRTSDSDCSGWATPAARDWRDGRSNLMTNNSRPLNEQAVMLAGRGTPRATDGTNGGPNQGDQSALPVQAHGATSSSSRALTEKCGVLSPVLPMWLMGFPLEWIACAPINAR